MGDNVIYRQDPGSSILGLRILRYRSKTFRKVSLICSMSDASKCPEPKPIFYWSLTRTPKGFKLYITDYASRWRWRIDLICFLPFVSLGMVKKTLICKYKCFGIILQLQNWDLFIPRGTCHTSDHFRFSPILLVWFISLSNFLLNVFFGINSKTIVYRLKCLCCE